jgi:hypothetical protein
METDVLMSRGEMTVIKRRDLAYYAGIGMAIFGLLPMMAVLLVACGASAAIDCAGLWTDIGEIIGEDATIIHLANHTPDASAWTDNPGRAIKGCGLVYDLDGETEATLPSSEEFHLTDGLRDAPH